MTDVTLYIDIKIHPHTERERERERVRVNERERETIKERLYEKFVIFTLSSHSGIPQYSKHV